MTRTEFTARFPSEYMWLRRHKKLDLLNTILPLNKCRISIDKIEQAALLYENRFAFQKFARRYYFAAIRYGILDVVCQHMRPGLTKWNRTTATAEAKKYKNKSQFAKNGKGAYEYLRVNGYLKYLNFFKKRDSSERTKAANLLSLQRMLSRMPKNVSFKVGQQWNGHGKYIFIHNTLGEFTLESRQSSNSSAWKKGRSGHPKDIPRGHRRKTCKNIETGEKFTSAREASLKMGYNKGKISNSIKSGTTCGGYHWAYCDEDGNIIE
jgi:hypothetical protein